MIDAYFDELCKIAKAPRALRRARIVAKKNKDTLLAVGVGTATGATGGALASDKEKGRGAVVGGAAGAVGTPTEQAAIKALKRFGKRGRR